MINPSSIYIVDDLLEEIFLLLPLKPILKSKTVSKRWRSILESKNFVKRRVSLQKSRKILAAYNCDCARKPWLLPESRFKGDEEIVYLHCDTTRPSMTCDGLVCIPEQDWINVLNPWTRQLRRFCFGAWWPGYSRVMGFGCEKVTGSYKVVKMETWSYSDHHRVVECSVLDVETGQWWMMTPPSYNMLRPLSHKLSRKSVCVNGSIYWLQHVGSGYKILALNLHKEKFHHVSVPLTRVTQETQIASLENRLTLAATYTNPEWKLDIWRKDTRWNKTYSISLAGKGVPREIRRKGFTPVSVSKQGNLVFTDDHKRLFKYYPRTDEIRCLCLDTCVISPFSETLAPLPLKSSTLPFPHPRRTYKCRLRSKQDELGIVELLITTLVALGILLGSLSRSVY